MSVCTVSYLLIPDNDEGEKSWKEKKERSKEGREGGKEGGKKAKAKMKEDSWRL
jgi:hypothetical protein